LADQYLALGQQLSKQVPNPFFGIVNQGILQTATVAQGQLLRPFPQFNGLTLASNMIGTSSYESFQLKLQRRFSHGASLLVAYTNAKLMTTSADSTTTALETDGGSSSFQDYNNFRAERSLSSFDVSQRLVASFAVDMPFGKNQPLLAGLRGPASKLISGWAMEGI
jgi:hypothetical protein